MGFVAKPSENADGTNNMLVWRLKIPAKASSIWAPGLFSATMTFTSEYPARPPRVTFDRIGGELLFHPNVYDDGGAPCCVGATAARRPAEEIPPPPHAGVCLSIINPPESTHGYGRGGTWLPTISIREVCLALQTFLDEPNLGSPASRAGGNRPYEACRRSREEYARLVKQQVGRAEVASG